MNYIVKPVNREVETSEYFDLFVVETVKDINDKDVQVARSIGQYSKAQLESEKANLEAQIGEIDKKLEALASQDKEEE